MKYEEIMQSWKDGTIPQDQAIDRLTEAFQAGEVAREELNTGLKELAAGYHFVKDKNVLTEEEARMTTVGYYPEQANGWGLLDTGTGTMDKVQIINGKTKWAVNTILPGGRVSGEAKVHIGGRVYKVLGDTLAEL